MSAPTEIRSPAVGTILEILVAPGESVTEDQELLVIESMKVEIPVVAPRDGTIASIEVELETQVAEDALLVTLA
ncbi:MAG: acetyl-CoA carboxylase biotin carboxyl carrier protein subunit [Candidatus Binatia bacterium]|nr:acetyl-CoA carboxylase biotin carboxyl carrier protein subunit [Candidatus Binatia bacterium]